MKRNIWGQSLISLKVRWYKQAPQAWDCFLWFTFVLFFFFVSEEESSSQPSPLYSDDGTGKKIKGFLEHSIARWFLPLDSNCNFCLSFTRPFTLQKQNLSIHSPLSAILLFLLWLNLRFEDRNLLRSSFLCACDNTIPNKTSFVKSEFLLWLYWHLADCLRFCVVLRCRRLWSAQLWSIGREQCHAGYYRTNQRETQFEHLHTQLGWDHL